MLVFCIGGIFLSLETFELAFVIFFIGAQLPSLVGAHLSEIDEDEDQGEKEECRPSALPAPPAFDDHRASPPTKVHP